MKKSSLSAIAATAMVIASAPAGANPVFGSQPAPVVANTVAGIADPELSDYAVLGDVPSAEELDQRGGNVVAVIVGGVVVATKFCKSNAACRTIAKQIISYIAKKGAQYVYANNEAELKGKLCQAGIRRYC